MPTTTKKIAAKQKTTAKVKKPITHKKAVASGNKASDVRSFQLCDEPKPFLTPVPSLQTFYWLIIGILVLLLGVWVMHLTVQIQTIYDNIGTTDTVIVVPHKK